MDRLQPVHRSGRDQTNANQRPMRQSNGWWLGTLAWLSLLLFGLGCQTPLHYQALRPAQYDLPKIQSVTVMPFDGPVQSGTTVAALLRDRLSQSERFTVLERPQGWDQELALVSANEPEVSTSFGRRLGAQAVLVGEVVGYQCVDDEKVEVNVFETEHVVRDRCGHPVVVPTCRGPRVLKENIRHEQVHPLLDRKANVTVIFRLIDVDTGTILLSKPVEANRAVTVAQHRAQTLRHPEQELQALLAKCVDQFLPSIAPYREPVAVELVSGNKAVRAGVRLAESGLWSEAAHRWESITRTDATNHRAWHNLAVAHEVLGQHDQALAAIRQAILIEPKSHYLDTQQRIEREQKLSQKAHAQLAKIQ